MNLDRIGSSRIFLEEMSGPTGLVSALWRSFKVSKSYLWLAREEHREYTAKGLAKSRQLKS